MISKVREQFNNETEKCKIETDLIFLFGQIVDLLKQFLLSKTDFLQIGQLGLQNGALVLSVPDLEAQVVDVLQRVLQVVASKWATSVSLQNTFNEDF